MRFPSVLTIAALSSRLSRREGQTLVEYSLILAVLTIVMVACFSLLGSRIVVIFSGITGILDTRAEQPLGWPSHAGRRPQKSLRLARFHIPFPTPMKPNIHPEYVESQIVCACGAVYHTRSTKQNLRLGICAACHPFFTGQQKFVDTAGASRNSPSASARPRPRRPRWPPRKRNSCFSQGAVGRSSGACALFVFTIRRHFPEV